MAISFLDLKTQYALMKDEVDEAVGRVVRSGVYIGGEEVSKFEEELASYNGVRHAVSMSSGTDALLAALMAIGVGPGDEVITSPFTFIATAEVVMLLGARPVFADIEEGSFNIDPELIEKRITERTKCIIPVHLFGLMADMDRIGSIARHHNLRVIEDAAQAVGAYMGPPEGMPGARRKACTFGDAGCLSFFPSKNLGAFGDGGMLLTNDDEIARKARMIKDHGSEKRYYHAALGFNGRLDSIQAAVLRVKLKNLDRWAALREKNARYYNSRLSRYTTVPRWNDACGHVFNQYSILTDGRDELVEHLKARGVPTAIYYPVPLHLQEVFFPLDYRQGDFPVAERVSGRILSLPVYPELPEEERAVVADSVVAFFERQ
jgi:UDP-2-acetamido-2-deoxy-ribo-hexuluronate aminotransferase